MCVIKKQTYYKVKTLISNTHNTVYRNIHKNIYCKNIVYYFFFMILKIN